MGMRRLSIIDLEGGWQPVYNEDRSIAICYNGETYNYVELREELERQGPRLHARTATPSASSTATRNGASRACSGA